MRKIKPVIKAKIWTGLWSDDSVGWYSPKYISQFNNYEPEPHPTGYGQTLVRCEVTIKPVKDKNGRYIFRKMDSKEQP